MEKERQTAFSLIKHLPILLFLFFVLLDLQINKINKYSRRVEVAWERTHVEKKNWWCCHRLFRSFKITRKRYASFRILAQKWLVFALSLKHPLCYPFWMCRHILRWRNIDRYLLTYLLFFFHFTIIRIVFFSLLHHKNVEWRKNRE